MVDSSTCSTPGRRSCSGRSPATWRPASRSATSRRSSRCSIRASSGSAFGTSSRRRHAQRGRGQNVAIQDSRPFPMLLLYLLSGFSRSPLRNRLGSRVLALHLGHTAGAISTVLAAFMGGLAAGAFVAGGYAGRLTRRNALRAICGGRAACRLLRARASPGRHCLSAAAFGHVWRRAIGDLWGGRMILCLALMTMPAALMGATYPLAVRAAGSATGGHPEGGCMPPTPRAQRSARSPPASCSYRGSATSERLWSALSSMRSPREARGGCRCRDRSEASPVQPDPSRPRDDVKQQFVSSGRDSRWPPCSSQVPSALLCEVAWTRVFAMILGPTTYAFATMLAAFIGGIAVGAVAGVRLGHRPRAAGRWAGRCWSPAPALPPVFAVDLPAAAPGRRMDRADLRAQFLPVLLREAHSRRRCCFRRP